MAGVRETAVAARAMVVVVRAVVEKGREVGAMVVVALRTSKAVAEKARAVKARAVADSGVTRTCRHQQRAPTARARGHLPHHHQ